LEPQSIPLHTNNFERRSTPGTKNLAPAQYLPKY
jgi:hypothetical protein